MTKYSGSFSSNKRTTIRGSLCSKRERTFNDRISLNTHNDHDSRACVPMPAGLSQLAAPGTLTLPVDASHDTVIGAPPDAARGHKISIFASTLDAQDGMSVSSTKVEYQFNDFSKDDRKSAVLQDDSAIVHNNISTVGYDVPAYRFMS
jgi:hypothetical protein